MEIGARLCVDFGIEERGVVCGSKLPLSSFALRRIDDE